MSRLNRPGASAMVSAVSGAIIMSPTGSARAVDRWLELQGRGGRRADLRDRLDAAPAWWLNDEMALVLRISDAVETNGAVMILRADRPRLRDVERMTVAVAQRLLPEGGGPLDRVVVHLTPEDGWCLPAVRSLGFTLDVRGQLPPRKTARLTAHRGIIEALVAEVTDVDPG